MTGAFVADVHRCANQRRARSNLVYLFAGTYGLQALLAYRLGRWLLHARRKWHLWPLLPVCWPLYFLLSRYARVVFDIRLDLSADIGPGFYIGHFGGISVTRCAIGANCSVGPLTQIAAGLKGQGPTIGDRVWIGAHANIVGPYRIGSGATVAAGAVLRHDIPEGALCIGNPARVVVRNYDNRMILAL